MANTAIPLKQPDWLQYWFAPVVRHCVGNELAKVANEIKLAGGVIVSMDVNGAKYKLTIYRRNDYGTKTKGLGKTD